MERDSLLVEIHTEELPPKLLMSLAHAFASQVYQALDGFGLLHANSVMEEFATPRRLALHITLVAEQAQNKELFEKLMPSQVAFDKDGKPSQALLKKMAAKGIPEADVGKLERVNDGKAEAVYYRFLSEGALLKDILADLVNKALAALPVARVMRWGSSDIRFVRPVHSVILLYGEQKIAGEVLGLMSGRSTAGHRFLSRGSIIFEHADDYKVLMNGEACVVVSATERRNMIELKLIDLAKENKAVLGEYQDLLDEVCALVEYPEVYVGEFEAEFLAVPQECLILTMRANQKYFPLFDEDGRLLNKFLIVSNMRIEDPSNIITGNQRVIKPRLADARFFFEQDKKRRLDSRVEQLASVVYHNRLGSVLERVGRIEKIAAKIAPRVNTDVAQCRRAAYLAKADLVTDMVGEFPELQGVMGRYYALHDGETEAVAQAIAEHYQPRFAGDSLPASMTGTVVSLADKLDVLVGLFAIGQKPTGDKDPFALRRAALGVLRMLIENSLPISLSNLLDDAVAGFGNIEPVANFREDLSSFFYERLRNYYRDMGISLEAIDAVLGRQPELICEISARIAAVTEFATRKEAQVLASANKRIGNIIKKNGFVSQGINSKLCLLDAEIALCAAIDTVRPVVTEAATKRQYTKVFAELATMAGVVDAFFNQVMVMDENMELRNNRLAILSKLYEMMNVTAELAYLDRV